MKPGKQYRVRITPMTIKAMQTLNLIQEHFGAAMVSKFVESAVNSFPDTKAGVNFLASLGLAEPPKKAKAVSKEKKTEGWEDNQGATSGATEEPFQIIEARGVSLDMNQYF